MSFEDDDERRPQDVINTSSLKRMFAGIDRMNSVSDLHSSKEKGCRKN